MTISGDGVTFEPITFEVTEDFTNTTGALFSGLKEHYVDASTERQSSVVLKQETALPLNVMSLTLRYQVEMQ